MHGSAVANDKCADFVNEAFSLLYRGMNLIFNYIHNIRSCGLPSKRGVAIVDLRINDCCTIERYDNQYRAHDDLSVQWHEFVVDVCP